MGFRVVQGSVQEKLLTQENRLRAAGQQSALNDMFTQYRTAFRKWSGEPVLFTEDVLGLKCDPWQADVLQALQVYDNVAIRACHGVGKTAIEAAAILWFTMCRPYCKVPTTAPTFNKQVRDILWAEIHLRWMEAQKRAPWLSQYFDISTTRFQSKINKETWFSVGIASSEPLNIEGYHAPYLMAVFDEAKAIKNPIWDAIEGMRTTQSAKLLAASTPGGPLGHYYDIFVKYRSTWKSQFIIHPAALRETLKRPEAPKGTLTGGVRYSTRVRAEWVEARRVEWGEESPVYIARVVGDFPQVSGDTLIPYGWIIDAEAKEQGGPGVPAVSCDAARFGRDRTVIFGGVGGTLMYGETVARTLGENTDITAAKDVGPDPNRPLYRSVVATADRCQLMRRRMSAETGVGRIPIVVDETGLGGGIVDTLRSRGEWVVPITFGAKPTDVPKDAEERARRQRRHLLDSNFANIKAEMGMDARMAFEVGNVALARLPQQILDPLIQQTAMMKYEMDAAGRIRLVDPDELDEYAAAAGLAEGQKSPDHFHSLMLYLFVALEFGHTIAPQAGPKLPKGVRALGHGQPTPQVRRPAGQAAWIMRRHV
jgi:phage terminase large subunit